MKKIFIIILATFTFAAVASSIIMNVSRKEKKKMDKIQVVDVIAERIMNEVGHGLYKVHVNDSVNVLIYRGVESVSMIQIK